MLDKSIREAVLRLVLITFDPSRTLLSHSTLTINDQQSSPSLIELPVRSLPSDNLLLVINFFTIEV